MPLSTDSNRNSLPEGWGRLPAGANGDPRASSANLHTEEFQRMKKLRTVTVNGDRLEQLKVLAQILSSNIDACQEGSQQTLAQLCKQYRETIREIEEIEGFSKEDDEIGEILTARKADGKPDAIR